MTRPGWRVGITPVACIRPTTFNVFSVHTRPILRESQQKKKSFWHLQVATHADWLAQLVSYHHLVCTFSAGVQRLHHTPYTLFLVGNPVTKHPKDPNSSLRCKDKSYSTLCDTMSM